MDITTILLLLQKKFLSAIFNIYPDVVFVCIYKVTRVNVGIPGGASGKEPSWHCRRHKRRRFDPWTRKVPGGGHGNPLQYSCLENPHGQRNLTGYIHGVTKSRTQLKPLSMHAGRANVGSCAGCTLHKVTPLYGHQSLCRRHNFSFLIFHFI